MQAKTNLIDGVPHVTIHGLFRVQWVEGGDTKDLFFEHEDTATLFAENLKPIAGALVSLECWNSEKNCYTNW
jgi:hypothetical protein